MKNTKKSVISVGRKVDLETSHIQQNQQFYIPGENFRKSDVKKKLSSHKIPTMIS